MNVRTIAPTTSAAMAPMAIVNEAEPWRTLMG